jgi:hypothetical protein
MRKQVTAKLVWEAQRRWCTHPCIRTNAAYQRIRKAYERRFPKRRLDLFNQRVTMVGWEVN